MSSLGTMKSKLFNVQQQSVPVLDLTNIPTLAKKKKPLLDVLVLDAATHSAMKTLCRLMKPLSDRDVRDRAVLMLDEGGVLVIAASSRCLSVIMRFRKRGKRPVFFIVVSLSALNGVGVGTELRRRERALWLGDSQVGQLLDDDFLIEDLRAAVVDDFTSKYDGGQSLQAEELHKKVNDLHRMSRTLRLQTDNLVVDGNTLFGPERPFNKACTLGPRSFIEATKLFVSGEVKMRRGLGVTGMMFENDQLALEVVNSMRGAEATSLYKELRKVPARPMKLVFGKFNGELRKIPIKSWVKGNDGVCPRMWFSLVSGAEAMRVVGVDDKNVSTDTAPGMKLFVLVRALMMNDVHSKFVYRTLVTDGELYAWVTTPDLNKFGPFLACHGPRLSSADREVIRVALNGYSDAVR